MKLVLTYAKRFRKHLSKRKASGHRRSSQLKDKLVSSQANASSGSLRPVLEKAGYSELDQVYTEAKGRNNNIIITSTTNNTGPPSYQECVNTFPVLPVMVTEKQVVLAAPVKKVETVRGRSTEILYRSQMTDIMRRKSIRRPSPTLKRKVPTITKATITAATILELSANEAMWRSEASLLCIAAILFTAVTVFVSTLCS